MENTGRSRTHPRPAAVVLDFIDNPFADHELIGVRHDLTHCGSLCCPKQCVSGQTLVNHFYKFGQEHLFLVLQTCREKVC